MENDHWLDGKSVKLWSYSCGSPNERNKKQNRSCTSPTCCLIINKRIPERSWTCAGDPQKPTSPLYVKSLCGMWISCSYLVCVFEGKFKRCLRASAGIYSTSPSPCVCPQIPLALVLWLSIYLSLYLSISLSGALAKLQSVRLYLFIPVSGLGWFILLLPRANIPRLQISP